MMRVDEDQGGPTLVSTGSIGGWKLPALIMVVVLVGLVAITRLGGPQGPAPVPSRGLAAGPTLTTRPAPTAKPTQAPLITRHLSGVMPRSPDGLTYADGIPTGISGEPVYRVRDVLLVPVGRTVLVGGWYLSGSCRASRRTFSCPTPTMSDVPLVIGSGDVRTDFVALDSRLVGTGAHIVVATVEGDPRCSIPAAGSCQPRLKVLQQIWSDRSATRLGWLPLLARSTRPSA